MKRTIAATAFIVVLSIGGIAVAATGGGSPRSRVPDYDPKSPNYSNPARNDPKSPGRAHGPKVQHSPDDEYACGYKFKDLPALGYHPPDYVDDEGVGPAVITSHDDEDSSDPRKRCRLMTRADVERQRQYIRDNGEAPSGEVVK